MQFAICEWDLEPTAKTVEAWAASGVTAVEPGAVFLTTHTEAETKTVDTLCRAAGIRIYACHAPFGGENDLSLLDDAVRAKAIAAHRHALERAALLDAACLVIHPSGGNIPAHELPLRRAKLVDSLGSLLKEAERTGVRLALENMLPNQVGSTSEAIRQIVDGFDSPLLQVCFDTGHAHLNPEGALAAFHTLGERIIAFHLQDNDGNLDRHLQPPYGTIAWAPLVSEMVNADFDFPWSVETPPWNHAGWRVLLDEMQALFTRGLLAVPLFGDTMVNVVCEQCGHYCFGTPDDWTCACCR